MGLVTLIVAVIVSTYIYHSYACGYFAATVFFSIVSGKFLVEKLMNFNNTGASIDYSKPPPAKDGSKMKAFVQVGYGKDISQVIQLDTDVPKPSCGPTDVLVRVECAAADPVDYKCLQGNLQLVMKHQLPFVYGQNFSGTVVECGAATVKGKGKGSVTDGREDGGANSHPDGAQPRFKPGDRVCGLPSWAKVKGRGTFAEYCSCPIDMLCLIPTPPIKGTTPKTTSSGTSYATVSFEQAAAVPLTGCTAFQALTSVTLQPYHKLLILGGSTSVGLAAIQIAKLMGCRCISVTSTQKDLCQRLGASLVINYREQEWWKVLKDGAYDVILDCIGTTEAWDLACSQRVLKNQKTALKVSAATGAAVSIGKFVSVTRPNAEKPLAVADLLSFGLLLGKRLAMSSLLGYPSYSFFLLKGTHGLSWLLDRMADGEFEPVIDTVYSAPTMENFAAMLEKQMSGTAHGKLVMKIRSS